MTKNLVLSLENVENDQPKIFLVFLRNKVTVINFKITHGNLFNTTYYLVFIIKDCTKF